MSRADIARDAPAMAAACEGHEAAGHHDFKRESVREACGLMARYAEDPEAACAKLELLFSSPAPKPYCIKELQYMGGDANLCPRLAGEAVAHQICEGNAAFKRAFLAKSPDKCGDSIFCRVLMGGGPELCEPYARNAPDGATAEKKARALAAQAAGVLKDLEGARGRACREGFSLERLRGVYERRRLPAAAADDLFNRLSPDLERYYLCRAYAEDRLESCDDLRVFDAFMRREEGVEPIPYGLLCRTLYYEALISKAMVSRSPDIAALCVKRNLAGDRDFKLDSLEKSCGIVAEYSGSTATTCGSLGPYFDNASIAKTCPKMLRFVTGDASVCPLFEDSMVRERCRGYVGFGKAYAARDPALCGDSNYCRTLMGGGEKTCEPYLDRLGEGFCAGYAPSNLARVFVPLLDEARESVALEALRKELSGLKDRFRALER